MTEAEHLSEKKPHRSLLRARTMGPVVRSRWFILSISGLLSLLATVLGLFPFYAIYLIVEQLFSAGGVIFDQQQVWWLALASLAAALFKALASAFSTHLSHIAAYDILYDTRMALAHKMGRMPLGYFYSNATGTVKKVIHEDVEQMEDGIAHIIPDSVGGIATPLLIGSILFSVDWRMALVTIASLPLSFILYTSVMARMGNVYSDYGKIMARLNAVVIEYINGMKVIKAFLQSSHSFAKLKSIIDEVYVFYEKMHLHAAGPMTLISMLARSALPLVFPAGILFYLSGSLSIPTFALFLVLGIGFNNSILKLMMGLGPALWQILPASKRISTLLSETELSEPVNPQVPQDYSLVFRDVHFSYNDGTPVLKGVDLTIPQGSVCALVGPSGAGKTTMARLIPRFWDVTQGEIQFGHVNIKDIGNEQLLEHISFVFQEVFLFDDTVYENIRMGRLDATEEEVIAAAKAARCHDFITQRLELGYQTVVGENGSLLSGGERQRISIARAILKDAPVVVLDEATAFVDPENESLIQEALGELLRSGKTLVIVAHRLSTIVDVDQIVVVDDGRVLARGTHTELLATCELYRTQWDAHTSAQEWAARPAIQHDEMALPSPAIQRDEQEAALLSSPYASLKTDDPLHRTLLKLAGHRQKEYRRAIIYKLLDGVLVALPTMAVLLTLLELFQPQPRAELLWLYLGLLFVCFVGQFLTGYQSSKYFFATDGGIQRDVRLYLAEYMRRLPLGFFTRNDTGKVDALFTTNTQWLEIHLITELTIIAVVTPTLLFTNMLILDWRLALAAAAGVPVGLFVMRASLKIFEETWLAQSKARIKANSRIIEYIQGIPIIQAFRLAGGRLKQFQLALDEYRLASTRTTTKLTPAIIGFTTVVEIGFALVILLGAWLLINNLLSSTMLIVFLIVSVSFYAPLLALGDLLPYQRIIQNAVRNINEFVQTPLLPEPSVQQQPQRFDIALRQVHFSYESRPVLKDVSLTIPERTMTALVGPSGSGKTTITNLIARFWDVQQGKVMIGGVDVRDMPMDVLLAQITMVFQDVYLFHDTVLNNIRFGSPQATMEEVVRVAKAACCHDFILEMEQGYETVIGEGGATLSGGQRQRLSIARALLKNAPIILLDEATASIDPENERQIQQALNALIAEKTLIVIAHRLSTIQSADQILVLQQGEIVQHGLHADLLEQDGLYRQFWQERQRARSWRLGAGREINS